MASDPGPGKAARSSLVARDETQARGPGSRLRINGKLPYASVLKALGCLDELPRLWRRRCAQSPCASVGEKGGIERHPDLSVGGPGSPFPRPRGQDLCTASVRSLGPGWGWGRAQAILVCHPQPPPCGPWAGSALWPPFLLAGRTALRVQRSRGARLSVSTSLGHPRAVHNDRATTAALLILKIRSSKNV